MNATGLLLILVTPYVTWGIWFGFACIFYETLRKPVPLRDAILGYMLGVVYWSTRVYSVIPAYGWGMFVKMVGLASIPWLILLLGTSIFAKQAPQKMIVARVMAPGLLWVFMMQLFRWTPVDSFPLELMFHQPLPFWQIGVLGGVELLIFVILSFNAALAMTVVKRSKKEFVVMLLFGIAGLSIYGWGMWRLQSNPPEEGDVPVAIIQSNFPISIEWREENPAVILDTYRAMANEAATHSPQMMFFPQYNLSVIMNEPETLDFFGNLARETNSYMAVGTFTDFAPDEKGEEKQYNIAYVFSPGGEMIGSYKAIENLPFREVGEAFGSSQELIDTPAGKAGVLLCYEHSLHRLAKRWKAIGADYIMILTNPSTFASDLIRRSHIQQAQLRAIETQSEVVLATANGPSVVIDAFGRKRTASSYDEQRIVYSTISSR